MKTCFECQNKCAILIPTEDRKNIKHRFREIGKPILTRVPEMLFFCAVHEKPIRQTDEACEFFEESEFHRNMKDALKETARKLRQANSTRRG